MKEQAIELRKSGHSLTEIGKILKKGDSTIYRWIKDIPDTLDIKSRRKKNLITGLSNGRKNKFANLRKEYHKIGNDLFLKNENFRRLCLLYWCEGSKDKRKNTFTFCNTDPIMIEYVIKILKEIGCYKRQYLYIVGHQDSASDEEMLSFWSNIAETKNITIRRKPFKITKRKNRHKYGICTLAISSTKLACMVIGCIEGIKNCEIRLYQENESKLNRTSGTAAL